MFGEKYTEIHAFLDQYFSLFGPYHRIVLHHQRGIALVVSKYPGPVRKVAEQHIFDDLGCVPADWTDPEFDMDRDYADSWLSKGAMPGGLDELLKRLFS